MARIDIVPTDIGSKLDDALVGADDLFAEQELLHGDLRLHALRELLEGVYDPVLAFQRKGRVVSRPICANINR